jgi:putative lipoic acid-binding regulatory protein
MRTEAVNISDNIKSKELILDYPCTWTYKLIIAESTDIEKVLSLILKNREYVLNNSKISKKGTYKSYSLKLEVKSSEDRQTIFQSLQKEKSIKFIL